MIENSIVRIALSDVLCLTVALVLAAALINSGRRRWVYAAVAVSVSIIMVVIPLLQADGIVRFQARRAEAAASTQTIAEALGVSDQSPALSLAEGSVISRQSPVTRNTQHPIPNIQYPISNIQPPKHNPHPTPPPTSTAAKAAPPKTKTTTA